MKRIPVIALLLMLLLSCISADAYAAEELTTVHCDEQGFSIAIPSGKSAYWEDGLGMRVSVGTPGYVPFLGVSRRSAAAKLNDPVNYLNNVYREYMEGKHGDSVGTNPCVIRSIGGKRLYSANYHYTANGYGLVLTRMVEVRDDGDVEYFAKYQEGQGDEALSVLDTVVRYYRPDASATAAASAPAAGTKDAKSMWRRGGNSGGNNTGKGGGKQLPAEPAKPLISGLTQYGDGRFNMKLPEGWQIMTQSDYMTFCFKAWDPADPDRTIFMFMKLEPFLKGRQAKSVYQQINSSLGGNSMYKFFSDAPVMESCSLKGFLDSIPEVYDFCDKYYESGLTISPSVLPQMKNVKILEKTPSSIPAPDTCRENVIGRVSFEDYLGKPCEGLVTAQPVDMMSYDFYGVDGWPYTVYLFTGVTSPAGEMQELEGELTECLGSFSFSQSYVKKAVAASNEETKALREQGRAMQAAHDAMVDAWYEREKTHDIALQKWSDGFKGYDRLYDSSTGEVYLAETGFYDSYDLHRDEYNNSGLYIVDSETQNYYLENVDYYITK